MAHRWMACALICCLLGVLYQCHVALQQPWRQHVLGKGHDWLSAMEPLARDALLKNIHPVGTKPGVVVASPSQSKPNYYYHWTRDAALTMSVVAHLLDVYHVHDDLLWDYAVFERGLQQVVTRSGLGEPKYNVVHFLCLFWITL